MWGIKRGERWHLDPMTGKPKRFRSKAAAQRYVDLSWPWRQLPFVIEIERLK